MSIDTKKLETDPDYWRDLGLPDDADYFCPDQKIFLKQDAGGWLVWFSARTGWERIHFASKDADDFIARPLKPLTITDLWGNRWRRDEKGNVHGMCRTVQVVEWKGEDLPPVGCECQVLHQGEWLKCHVLAHGEDHGEPVAFAQTEFFTVCGVERGFRPFCTKEQRDRDDLACMIEALNQSSSGNLADAIIAAGWRKRES